MRSTGPFQGAAFRAHAVVAATVVWLLLPFIKLPRLLRAIESRQRDARLPEQELRARIDALHSIASARFFVIRKNCLKKSLLLYYFLLRYGVKNVAIRIGVDKRDGRLDGHAWLTVEGKPLLDSEEFVSRYKVIYFSEVRS